MDSVAKPWNREMVLAHDERLPSPRERFKARFIDAVLVGSVACVLLVPGLIFEIFPLTVVGLAMMIFGTVTYEAVCVAAWGYTLGKKVEKLRVVQLSDGAKPSVLRSIVRALVVTLAFSYWAWVSVATNRAHRGPHDKAAGTIVIYA